MTGSDSLENAVKVKNQIIHMLELGRYKLRNGLQMKFLFLISQDLHSDVHALNLSLEINNEVIIIGVSLSPYTDTFSFRLYTLVEHKLFTRHIVLLKISKLLDNMRWKSPITIKFKLFIQQISKSELNWDGNLPDHLILK